MRLIHAVREVNAAGDGPIQTVALHTTGEANAMFVREADLAYDLGPASARPYLDLAVLEKALVDSGADAAWPGWGFVAEDPAFVDLCDKLGVTFIGPSADAMRRLGDKIGSEADRRGGRACRWRRGAAGRWTPSRTRWPSAAEVGYPLMLKASAGGGGRGIRMVASPADLEDAYQRTSDEALRAFGNGTVFLERLVTGARHVEVQLIADSHGTAWAVGVRDCSIQRRNQKVIEESSSPLLSPEQNEELKASAERLAQAVGYVGAGHRRVPLPPRREDVRVPRGQHPAPGGALDHRGHHRHRPGQGADPGRAGRPPRGREAGRGGARGRGPAQRRGPRPRLRAVPRPHRPPRPAVRPGHPGRHRRRRGRHHPAGLRLDDRQDHRLRAHPRGGPGPAPPRDVLDHRGDRGRRLQQELRAGPARPARGRGRHRPVAGPTPAGSTASAPRVGSSPTPTPASRWSRPPSRPTSSGCRSRPPGCSRPPTAAARPRRTRSGVPVELKLRGVPYQVSTVNTGPGRFRVSVASGATSQTVDVQMEWIDAVRRRLVVGGRRYNLVTATHGPTTLVEVDGVAHRVSRDEGGVLRSPAPALVVATPVGVGDEVEAGAAVVVLESMKMETVVHAPFAARVKELLVITGSQVETGSALIKLEPVGDGAEEAVADDGPDLDLPAADEGMDPEARGARARAALTAVVLGYDVPPEDQDAALSEYLAVRDEMRAEGESVAGRRARPADDLRRPRRAEPQPAGRRGPADRAAGALLARALPHLPAEPRRRAWWAARAVPGAAGARARALRRGGPRAHARAGGGGLPHLPGPAALDARGRARVRRARLLERRDPADRAARGPCPGAAGAPRPRHPVALPGDRRPRPQRAVPLVRPAGRGRGALGHPARRPRRALRRSRPPATSPTGRAGSRPWRPSPSRSCASSPSGSSTAYPAREPMLEVLARRHYREYDLRDLQSLETGARPVVVAGYTLDDRPTRLVSAVGTVDELGDPSGDLVTTLDGSRRQPRGGRGRGRRPLPALGRCPRGGRRDERAASGPCWRRSRSPATYDGVCVAVCAGGDRPVGYYVFRPDHDGEPGRGRPHPRRAPDGRAGA